MSKTWSFASVKTSLTADREMYLVSLFWVQKFPYPRLGLEGPNFILSVRALLVLRIVKLVNAGGEISGALAGILVGLSKGSGGLGEVWVQEEEMLAQKSG